MAKEKTVYICKNCGYRSIKWLGKCPSCGEWNTLEEQTAIAFAAPAPKNQARARSKQTQAQLLSGIRDVSTDRTSTDIAELDRVLGGGVVNGELILLSGDPGIGKSTLALQMAANIAQKATVLYISAEESAEQVKMRANRLDLSGQIYILPQTDLSAAEEALSSLNPAICHRRFHPNRLSAADQLLPRKYHPIKRMHRAAHALGESPRDQHPNHRTRHQRRHRRRSKNARAHGRLRLIFRGRTALSIPHFARSQKSFRHNRRNRHFLHGRQRTERGLKSLRQFYRRARQCRLRQRRDCLLEGTRPLLVEMQALVIPSFAANPRRTASGVDFNRLLILLAVLEKHAGLRLSNQDVFANTIGGFRIDEPAADMALLAALASAYNNQPLKNDCPDFRRSRSKRRSSPH